MDLQLTTKAQEAFSAAVRAAAAAGHPHTEPAHLMAALLDQQGPRGRVRGSRGAGSHRLSVIGYDSRLVETGR